MRDDTRRQRSVMAKLRLQRVGKAELIKASEDAEGKELGKEFGCDRQMPFPRYPTLVMARMRHASAKQRQD